MNADLVIQTVTIYVSTLIRDIVVIVTQDSSYIKWTVAKVCKDLRKSYISLVCLA